MTRACINCGTDSLPGRQVCSRCRVVLKRSLYEDGVRHEAVLTAERRRERAKRNAKDEQATTATHGYGAADMRTGWVSAKGDARPVVQGTREGREADDG